jgi:hypothetical protein
LGGKVTEDLYDHEEFIHPGPIKEQSKLFLPVLMLALGLGILALVYLFSSKLMAQRSAVAQPVAAFGNATPDDQTKRELTAFVEQFLMAYYCYSAGPVYERAVQRAESMMTPAFLAAYNQRAVDVEFKRKLQDLKVNTDAIHILPGSVTIGNEGDRFYLRLSGTMTFTTGINGASGDFPLSLLLAVEKTDSGFLVDNVERLR